MPILRAVIVNTESPLIGGSMISYSCSTGQTISGPNTSTCLDNGQWEPDPMDTLCAGITTIILLRILAILACICTQMHNMLISCKRTCSIAPPALFAKAGTSLKQVNSAKYLGVLLTSDLSWTKHNIARICSKTRKLIGLLYRRFHHCSP